MDNLSNISKILKKIGVPEIDLVKFANYTEKQGMNDLEKFNQEAHESGHVGCPHLVFDLNGKRTGLFGREHISLIRHTMSDLDLERNHDVKWQVPHFWKSEE